MEEMKTALEEVNEWYDANKEAEAEDLEEKRKALAEMMKPHIDKLQANKAGGGGDDSADDENDSDEL